jgi:cellulose biosynthesis protein BcsQ
MDNDDSQDESWLDPREELANDVALLYSWAKVDETSYRDFSGQRKRRPVARDLSSAGETRNSAEGNRSEHNSGPGLVPTPATLAGRSPATLPTSQPDKAIHEKHAAPLTGELQNISTITDGLLQETAAIASEARNLVQMPESPGRGSVLAVYSIAGGVGKSTLCANLGKTLCSLGEQILLVDASGRRLLPFYFGATEQRTGARRFAAPDAHGRFVDIITGEKATQEWLEREVKSARSTSQRIILDLGVSCENLLPTILPLCSVVLIPLLPDLNSMLTIPRLESSLNTISPGSSARAVFYVLNCFDTLSVNDQRVRELVAQQCGSHLLPIALRWSRELRESLHAGMPAADYTPGPELSLDYMELALWIRRTAPLSPTNVHPGRWSEQ